MNRSAVSRLARLALVCLVLPVVLLSLAPGRAAADPVAVTQGELVWGVKESWRNYVGTGLLSDGAAVNPNGTYAFPVVSGSYDDATKTTRLELAGTVHWQHYPDFPVPGRWGLDTTFTDLELEISPAAQVLRGTNIGYSREDPGGDLHAEVDVVLAKLDIAGATTAFDAGETSWSAIPAVAGAGMGLYPEGTPVDPVSFSYDGPGGVPDLGEHWDTPGGIALEAGGRWVSEKAFGTASNSGRALYASPGGDLLHLVELTGGKTANALLSFRGLDSVTMQPLGPAAQVTYQTKLDQYFKTDYDPQTETVFFATGGDGASKAEVWVRAARWNPATSTYDLEPVGQLRNLLAVDSLVWNPIAEELAVVQQISAAEGAGPSLANELNLFKRDAGGQWVKQTMPLPMPATGPYSGGVREASPFGCPSQFTDQNCLGVARDGSYIQAPASSTFSVDGAPLPWTAIHIEVSEGAAQTAAIPGTAATPNEQGVPFGYSATAPGADGTVLLHSTFFSQISIARVDVVDGVAQLVGSPYKAAEHGNLSSSASFAGSIADDAQRGWEWVTDVADPDSYVLNAMADGEIVSRHRYTEFVVQGYAKLAVGPDGSVYIPVKDQASGKFAYQRLVYVGRRATIGAQPQAAEVALGTEEESESASFTSTVLGGDPAPERQWQVKAPGSSSFADIPGEADATLTVEATRGMGGTDYRAVYSSGAGQFVSESATLNVEYAPQIVSEPASRSVVEGADAVFLLNADGAPEPTVTWQRRVGGFWQSIAPDDDNFVVNGPSLTVLQTNLEQSGALFRAKLANSVATVFSKTVKLTVTPKVTIPDEGLDLENVSLEWSGNPEMQKVPPFGNSNYFSAGVSAGDEATYSAFADNAAVYQVTSSGTESFATWATRAGHVASGGRQVVRLFGGDARIEPDGSATVEWEGAFSVNFYGGMVPFSVSDPVLTIDDQGDGTLVADLQGCASSQANPDECAPLAPASDVTVATFSGVDVDPAGVVSVEPDYAGVEVTVPVPFAPQSRVGAEWGAWPQEFVDFHLATGLSSYWYSSGGAFDPYKKPDPFLVDFDGEALPDPPPPEPKSVPPVPLPVPPEDDPGAKGDVARISAIDGVQLLDRRRATIATLTCPGEGFCAVLAPRRVKLRIGRKPHWAKVIVPRTVDGGDSAELELRLSRRAARKLGSRTATGRLGVTLRTQTEAVESRIAVRLRKGS